MISYEAADEMVILLSNQTKDELNRFYKENLGVPPEFEEIFNSPKLLMI